MGLHLADYERKGLGMDERRKFSRILFATNAHLQQGVAQWETTILDLSLNGAFGRRAAKFYHSGDAITLSFILPESDI